MALMKWATHVLQWVTQKVTNRQLLVNLIKLSLFRLFSAIREHKGGIASNRESEGHGEFNS